MTARLPRLPTSSLLVVVNLALVCLFFSHARCSDSLKRRPVRQRVSQELPAERFDSRLSSRSTVVSVPAFDQVIPSITNPSSARENLDQLPLVGSHRSDNALAAIQRHEIHHLPGRCTRNMSATLTVSDFYTTRYRIAWTAQQGRYLFPLCQKGRLSNQVVCLRRYLWFASLLNRTLVIPRLGFKDGWLENKYYRWSWDLVLHAPTLRQCLGNCCGPRPVITLDEYLQREGGLGAGAADTPPCITIDHIAVLHPRSWPDMSPKTHPQPGVCPTAGRVEMLFDPVDNVVRHARWEELKGSTAQVLSMGSSWPLENIQGLEFLHLGEPPSFSSGVAPAPAPCHSLMPPHPALRKFVADFIDGTLGTKNYAAIHLRRGDFFRSHKLDESGSYMSLLNVAKFVARWLEPLDLEALYIASDGSPAELQNLRELLLDKRGSRPLHIVHLGVPQLRKSAPVHALQELQELEISQSGIVLAVAEKLLCTEATAFLGTPRSTFSLDIRWLRRATGRASCRDTFLDKMP